MTTRRTVGSAMLVCLMLGLAGPAVGQAPGGANLNPLADVPADATAAFTERPLFSESRRPVSRLVMPTLVAAPPAAPTIPTTANLQLLGIVQTARGTLARIRVAGSGDAQAVRSGETVANWTVTAITASAVALKQGEHVAALELFTPGARMPAPPAAAAPAAGAVPNAAAAAPARVAPVPPANSGAAPPGTVPGTAAAEAAANAPFALTFGGTPQ